MADEHFLAAGDFLSGLDAVPFFGSGPYAPFPAGLDVAAAMAPFGMLPWAYELPLPTDSAATITTAHFNSALSSLVSSPSHAGGDDVAIGDLIGRLGSICNTAASANNSRYSTPLSSPPRGASPAVTPAFRQGGYCYPGAPPPLQTVGGRLSRVASNKSLGGAAPALDSTTEAETSPTAAGKAETPAKGESASSAARKRKASVKVKTAAATNGSPKRSKVAGDEGEEKKPEPEPVKDYIHVRARRGQATDGHSLAERVRREKISERMKLLQSLVPGCNKITGKALMLDGIINYVQSLQRQVEFLSMKLSTMNPQLDVDAPQYLPSDNDVMHHQQTAAAMMLGLGYPHQDAAAAFPYADPFAGADTRPTTTTMDESCTGSSFHHPGAGGFGGWEAAAQDLRSIVHRHDVAPSSHDQQQLPSSHPHDGLHGRQQEAATLSHMNVEP